MPLRSDILPRVSIKWYGSQYRSCSQVYFLVLDLHLLLHLHLLLLLTLTLIWDILFDWSSGLYLCVSLAKFGSFI